VFTLEIDYPQSKQELKKKRLNTWFKDLSEEGEENYLPLLTLCCLK